MEYTGENAWGNDFVPLDTPVIINLNAPVNPNQQSKYPAFRNLNADLEKLLIFLDVCLSGEQSNFSGDGPAPWMESVCQILRQIIDVCKARNVDCLSVIIEGNKIDDYYRDAFFRYHAAKHYPYSRECIGVYIFVGDIYKVGYEGQYKNRVCKDLDKVFLGYLMLTPLNGCNISKSILSPAALVHNNDLLNATIRVCPYYCTMYGRHLNISGFPYFKQDSETVSCSEVTALLITDYYSQKFQDYKRVLPSDILRIADTYSPQRGVPSQGLQYNVLSHILKDIGFQPLLVESQREIAEDIHFLLHCYLDSSIPIALQISGEYDKQHVEHSICCIGFGSYSIDDYECSLDISLSEVASTPERGIQLAPLVYIVSVSSFCNEYFAMDDNDVPYKKMQYSDIVQSKNDETVHITPFTKSVIPTLTEHNGNANEVCRIANMIVPLDKDMRMLAIDARDICYNFLSSYTGLTRYLSNIGEFDFSTQDIEINDRCIPGKTPDNPLYVRVFLAPSHKLKTRRTIEFREADVLDAAYLYSEIPMPKFVWICELFTKESFKQGKCIGEIVLDATSTLRDAERSIILVHYPNLFAGHYPSDQWNPMFWKEKLRYASDIRKWRPFKKFYFGNTYAPKQHEQLMNYRIKEKTTIAQNEQLCNNIIARQ